MAETAKTIADSEAAGLLMLFSAQNSLPTEKPTSKTLKLAHITKSPGPAAAARASNKGIVAAAALAAAAATPIPIVHHRSNSFPEQTDSVSPDLQLIKQKPKTVPEEATTTSIISVEHQEKQEDVQQSLKDQLETEPEDNNDGDIASFEQQQQQQQIQHSSPQQTKKKYKKQNKQKESLPDYAVNPDSGIIGCICEMDHDDGFTIQCDKCFRWQHAACMNIENEDVPDNYLCYLCDPNLNLNLSAEKAKKLQESRLQPKRRKSPYETPSVNGNGGLDPKTGAAQFKKRKNENHGIDKFQTYYYPINYNIFKSSLIKSLYLQLPNLLKDNESVIKFEKSQLKKSLIDQNNLNVKSLYDNPKSKFTGISKIGLYTSQDIKPNQLITIFAGEIDIKQNYIMEKFNQYGLLGCAKPSVFFHPNLPIVIDERGMGNHTRFIRKSCTPNCEIKTILNNGSEPIFCLSSIVDIEYNDELTLPWLWDENHPINTIIKNGISSYNDDLNEDSKLILLNSLHNLLDLTDCACSSNIDCTILKLRKIIPQLKNLNSSSSSNLNSSFNKKYQYSYSPFPNQSHIPIVERYRIRDEKIEKQLSNNLNELKDKNNVNELTENGIIIDPYELILDMDDLPKKFKLLKEFKTMDKLVQLPEIELKDSKDDDGNLYTPIGLSSKLMSKLESANSIDNKTPRITGNQKNSGGDGSTQNGNDQTEIEKPKIKKKFSLADYKKKKTSI